VAGRGAYVWGGRGESKEIAIVLAENLERGDHALISNQIAGSETINTISLAIDLQAPPAVGSDV
jgi:hypothetical protein